MHMLKQLHVLTALAVCVLFFVALVYTRDKTHSFFSEMEHCEQVLPPQDSSEQDPTGVCYRAIIRRALAHMTPREFLLGLFAADEGGELKKQCHKIEHIIAQVRYEQTHDLEETIRSCTVIGCGNGCTHGAIAAHMADALGPSFDSEAAVHASQEKLPNLSKHLCEMGPSLCHGVGHVLVMQGGEMDSALALCRSVAGSRALGDCYSGVFMEYAQGYSAFTYRRPLQGEHYYADKAFNCERFSGLLQRTCFVHYPSHLRMVLAESGVPRAQLHKQSYPACARIAHGESRDWCFFGIGNTDGSKEECAFAPTARDEFFCAMGVGLFFKNPRSERVAYCESLPGPLMVEMCMNRFNELYVEAPKTGIGSESVK